MSVKYVPVQWNKNKWYYNGFMVAGVIGFLYLFLYVSPELLTHEKSINPQVHNARAFGACAFLMLSVILCIGPLARMDKRFLPLLYNRRHFGVMTAFVALTHFGYIINWYFAFSGSSKWETLIFSNTSYGQLSGFPFEMFGVIALLSLLILATTSHDFWLKFLTAPVWKRIHYLIYVAYASVVMHVSFGILQDQQNHVFTGIFILSALTVVALHVMAFLNERKAGDSVAAADTDGWVRVCAASDIPEARAKIAKLPNGDRVAVFRMDNKLSAISNACAHQNGPLGEGKILRCLVTCPWHGFQYDVRSGRSPAPFTEIIPTYNIAVRGDDVLVDPNANAPGTYVEPIEVPA